MPGGQRLDLSVCELLPLVTFGGSTKTAGGMGLHTCFPVGVVLLASIIARLEPAMNPTRLAKSNLNGLWSIFLLVEWWWWVLLTPDFGVEGSRLGGSH